MYHGLGAVAEDSDGHPLRFTIRPLPGGAADLATLKRWFRRFVEVRDNEGAERCITTAVRSGAKAPALAELMFSAATDHRYLTTGHVLDFTNKAFEALDHGAHDLAEPVLASLARSYATGERMGSPTSGAIRSTSSQFASAHSSRFPRRSRPAGACGRIPGAAARSSQA